MPKKEHSTQKLNRIRERKIQVDSTTSVPDPVGTRIRFSRPMNGDGQKIAKTQQHFRARTDIREIVKRAQRGGTLPVGRAKLYYGDFSNIPDVHQAFQIVQQAHDSFKKLPAKIRDQFQNNPENFISYINNPKNREECLKLGVFEREPTNEPILVKMADNEADFVKVDAKKDQKQEV